MARVSTGLLAGAVGFGVIAAAAIGVRAQGLVTIQKLSALLANELVGEAVAGEHVQTDRCPKPQPSGTASRHALPYGQTVRRFRAIRESRQRNGLAVRTAGFQPLSRGSTRDCAALYRPSANSPTPQL